MRNALALVAVAQALLLSPVVAQQPVIIEGTTLVSPHLASPLTDVSIFVRDGQIEAIMPADQLSIPSEVHRIDGRGKWVIPGLIEFHTHSVNADALSRGLGLGVTSAQVVRGSGSSPIEIELRSNLPDQLWPRLILLTGPIGQFVGAPTPMTVGEAESEVDRMRFSGVRTVKVWQDDGALWLPPEDTFAAVPSQVFHALVRRAHEQGMEVVAHAWTLEFFTLAIDAGVDRLIHPVADATVPDVMWNRMRQEALAWTTTMSVLLTYADIPEYARRVLADPRLVRALPANTVEDLEEDRFGREFARYDRYSVMREKRDLYMRMVRENTRNALANGVDIVLGSDATIGIGTHIEIELMAEAGLSPEDILRAATVNGARALQLDDRVGTVEVGKLADLAILNANPLEDARNLRDTYLVLKGGHVFEPADLFEP